MDLHVNTRRLDHIIETSKRYGCDMTREEILRIAKELAPPYESHLNSPDQPVVIVMCGPAGSGKSTIRNTIMAEFGMTPANTILADQDELLMKLEGGMACQRASGNIMRDVLIPAFAETGYHTVYDSTCRAVDFTLNAINEFKKHGYYVVMCQVYTTKRTALNRASRRARQVPPEIVKRIYDEFSEVAQGYLMNEHPYGGPVHVDEIRLYNNEGRVPKLLYKHVKSVPEILANNNFFFNYTHMGGRVKTRRRRV